MSAPHVFTPLRVDMLDLARGVAGTSDADLVAPARARLHGPWQWRDLFDSGE